MDYTTFNKGISGYTLQGANGSDGDDGRSVYYTAYSYDSSANIITKIRSGASLSNNDNVTESVTYRPNDLIICNDGTVVVIYGSSQASYNIQKLGNIVCKPQAVDSSITADSSIDSSVYFKMYESGPTIFNDYNYVYSNGTAEEKSPLYHHRSNFTERMNMLLIQMDMSKNTKFIPEDSSFSKIVIEFNNGLTYSSPFDSSIQTFLIDKNYFFEFGQASDSSYWSTLTITSEKQEFTDSVPVNSCINLMATFNNQTEKMCNGFIETSRMSDVNGKMKNVTYRIPINFIQ